LKRSIEKFRIRDKYIEKEDIALREYTTSLEFKDIVA